MVKDDVVASPPDGSVWRAPGFLPLLTATLLGFAGFAMLLPSGPMRALEIGAGAEGAGLVNAVLMLFTVLAQLVVAPATRRFGWARCFAAGLLFLGLPSLAMPLLAELNWLLAMSALRGLGFGLLTVGGATAVSLLVPPSARGRAVGAYGLSIALPQFLLTPLAPVAMETAGFTAVALAGALPVAALPWVSRIARHVGSVEDGPDDDGEKPGWAALLHRIWPSLVALLLVTTGGGAVLTFAAEMVDAPAVAALALAAFTGVAALGRWLIGGAADRWGPRRFIAPVLLLGAAGFAVFGLAASPGPVWLLLAAAGASGFAYGSLQNLTLVYAFAGGGERSRPRTSVVWNIGFDAGTGLGALAIGQLSEALTFPTAFLAMGAVIAGAAVVLGLALRFGRRA